jgi:hypothetical protein
MSDIVKRPDQESPPPPSAEVNFALVLSRMIDSVQQDPAQLRETVYELARIKLREQFGREDVREINRLVGALETAIDGVETFSRQHDRIARPEPPQALSPPDQPGNDPWPEPPSEAASARPQRRPLGSQGEPRAAPDRDKVEPRRVGAFAAMVRLLLVIGLVIAVAGGVALWPRLRTQFESLKTATQRIADGATAISAAPISEPKALNPERTAANAKTPENPAFPLPTTFGIYAVTEGQLFELKPLPGKIPDQRVAMSAAISAPSQTTIGNAETKFIVFRRDSANNAPDHTEVRVIAKVARAMAVDPSRKAIVSQAQDSWVVRNISFPYKIGPIDDHPEMFLVQPEASDLLLPPGRYALVIKGQGYDFTVAGPVTDPRQCVERVDATNGAFYSPCPGK